MFLHKIGFKHHSSTKRIQEVDDSFFEKFGSLLRQHSVKAAIAESTPLAPLHEEIVKSETITEEAATPSDVDVLEGGASIEARFGCTDTDSGNETLIDPDSETEEFGKLELYEEAVGWNIDELYKEILYEIVHNVGCDVSVEIGQLPLLGYVQDAFKIPNEKHHELLAEAEAKEPPDVMLNVEIIEAKDLQPKDPNGMSDPFVTMYLMSNKTQRYNTSVKTATLDPSWEEHFSLPVVDNPAEDTLCIEVWDFDPAESVKEKMSKILDVKGVKGLRKLMKEIAVTASTGKHDNELIGKANIPLKSIPTTGMTMWYSLDKPKKAKRQGLIKARLVFTAEKISEVAIQEHRHLLRILLLHELEHSKVAPYWWAGNYSVHAEALISQHSAQSGLGLKENNMAQWTVFCAIHADHPLSFALFNTILNKLMKPLETNQLGDDEVNLFWDGVRKILPSCYSIIRKLRKKTTGDKNVLKILKDVLILLCMLSEMKVPDGFDLFPEKLYGWLKQGEGVKNDVREVMLQAIHQGATEWFMEITENIEANSETEEGRLQNLIKIIQMVRSDLQRAVEYYDKCYAQTVRFPYSKTLYTIFEKKLSEIIEAEVVDVCKSLKRLSYNNNENQVMLADESGEGTRLGVPMVNGEPLAMGTTLFELYLVLQRFLALGQGLFPADWSSLAISKFHYWFHGGVAQWLDIAVFKAHTRIEKAVALDQLTPVDTSVKYSSSAVDTLAIFYQIKVFWDQLAWPDAEGSYAFVAKIIDDICSCCVYYADKMSEKVEGVGMVTTVYETKFQVTNEWCLAINNIDYVKSNLNSFVEELGMTDILSRLSDLRSPMEADRCKETLQNVIANSLDTITNKILELIEMVVRKMMPSISRFLLEGAELLHQDCSSMDRVMMYLEDSLSILHANLSEDNFTRTLDVIWDQLSDLLYKLVESNLEKRRPPSFFSNLHECLKLMINSFKKDNTASSCNDTLQRIEYLLKLHGFETSELIHQYFIERWEEQKKLGQSQFGVLAVRAMFCDSAVKIEVINARNLLPMDSNGSVDSFIRIHLMPEDLFAGTIRPKTQTHNKNLFPLYDETFTIILTPEQRNCKNGLIVFNVKDKDMFGMSNQYLAEAFLHFSEIAENVDDIRGLPQVHLMLSRPTKLEGDAIKSLEHRQGDKQAKEFLKKQKQKIGLPH
ncbi:C2 and C2B_Munc13-like domain-containing protein staccato isoform X3 [Arctopsyche grandis]|uniref:C2 and C2B_Munc13-like domain-containing protein staccato isoform X3 n=1 Tax=Arctopsyche grandis TaxID=121162 RepID=UPI00406D9F1D